MNTLPEQITEALPANMAERINRLKQQASQAGEVWQPDEGDSLIGVLVGSQKAAGAYGENYQILVQDETGKVIAAWLTDWIRQNLKAQGAERGDLIALTFLGKKLSPSGRPFNAYSLIVDKGGFND